jgi:hypothetical protein
VNQESKVMTSQAISHDRQEETIEAKARWFQSLSLAERMDVLAHEITVFKDRVRIDVQTLTPGLRFEDAWHNRETMEYQDQTFYVVSRDDLIASKRASGREVDLEDVRLLELGGEEQGLT